MNPVWLKYLPASMRTRIEHRPNLQKALANTGWLVGDKLLRMGVGLLVGLWVARYLGPRQYGLLNYAMAIVALFGAIANLGLNGIVVRDLVKEPKTTNTTLGTTFLLQVAGGLLAFALAIFAITLARPDDSLAKLMVTVLGFVLVLKAADVVRYWFESQVNSKYVVWVDNSTLLLLAAVKVGLILIKAPLMAFVWAAFAEGLLVAAGLFGLYLTQRDIPRKWKVRYSRAKTLLKDSWPLILSGLAVMVYMRIDQVMLGYMLGNEAVGVYSAAVRISEIWYFIPVAVVSSVFPSIIEAKKSSEEVYYQRLQKLHDVMVVIAFIGVLPATLASDFIVQLLFGHAYAGAGPVLAIHVWSSIFVFLGVASNRWFLIENLQRLAFYRTALGALVNFIANLIMIPMLGIKGAAIGTLLSQIFAAYLFDLSNKNTRRLFLLKTASLFQFFRYLRRSE